MEGQRNLNMKSESEKSKQVLVLHELYVSKHLTIMDIFPKLHCFTFTKGTYVFNRCSRSENTSIRKILWVCLITQKAVFFQ